MNEGESRLLGFPWLDCRLHIGTSILTRSYDVITTSRPRRLVTRTIRDVSLANEVFGKRVRAAPLPTMTSCDSPSVCCVAWLEQERDGSTPIVLLPGALHSSMYMR